MERKDVLGESFIDYRKAGLGLMLAQRVEKQWELAESQSFTHHCYKITVKKPKELIKTSNDFTM